MLNLLLNKEFSIEEYENNPVDKKIPRDRRWKVSFSGIVIALGFFTSVDAEKYIYKHGSLALWNALWNKGFQVSWDPSIAITKFDVKHLNKEM